jgi:hypothetical protein
MEKVPANQGDEGLTISLKTSSGRSATTFSFKEKESWGHRSFFIDFLALL